MSIRIPAGRDLVREFLFLVMFTLVIGAVEVGATLRSASFVNSSQLLIEMSPADLSRQAEAVFLADVVETRTRTANEGGTRPSVLTDNRLRVVESYKGSASGDVIATTRGGVAGTTFERNPDAPTFSVGQRVVVFQVGGTTREVLGGYQGRYVVTGNQAANEKGAIPFADLVKIIKSQQ